jgi:hypothetical protein
MRPLEAKMKIPLYLGRPPVDDQDALVKWRLNVSVKLTGRSPTDDEIAETLIAHDEYDKLREELRQLVKDEESGKIPYIGIEDSLPPLPPLPTHPDDVIATMVPAKK